MSRRREFFTAAIFFQTRLAGPQIFLQSEPEQNILEDLMVGLMTSDPAADPIPGMATSWTTLRGRPHLDLQAAGGGVVGRHTGDGG